MTIPKIGARETVYQDKYQQISKLIANFGSFSKEYFVNDLGERTGIVVVQSDTILLVRQYRFLINQVSWEIPGGAIEQSETPMQAAIRECLEETGLQCLSPRPLLFYQLALDLLSNPTHLFYCHETVDHPVQAYNAQEIRSWEWVPLKNCVDMIFTQEINDSFSIIAILAYLALQSTKA